MASSSKLEPFLLMAKSAKGAAAAKLINSVTAAPGVFVFAELLDLASIQEVRVLPLLPSVRGVLKSELDLICQLSCARTLSMHHIFNCWNYSRLGRMKNTNVRSGLSCPNELHMRSTMIGNQSSLPPLNAAQITKLKHLSIVTLASHSRVSGVPDLFLRHSLSSACPSFASSIYQILKYDHLLSTLEVPSIRALEDLIIDAMYQDVVRGRLDQKFQQFEVEYTMGRDLKPGQLESLLGELKDWYEYSTISFRETIINCILLSGHRARHLSSKHLRPRSMRLISMSQHPRLYSQSMKSSARRMYPT